MLFSAAPSHLVLAAQSSTTAFSALVWWTIPIVGVLGSIIYVVWISKFQDKFDNQTNRSVGKFKEFQKTFDPTRSPTAGEKSQPHNDVEPPRP
jgi:hypothetical protein